MALAGCESGPKALDDKAPKLAGGTIEIEIDPGVEQPRQQITEWVNRAAVAVSNYLGRFPVKQLVVHVHGGGGEPIGGGVTHGDSRIDVRLGPSAGAADFDQDWIMTHEMFHLAFPTLDDRYLWMMEGLSDYLEPVARARAGQVTAEAAWREFVEGLPQGLPRAEDHGLDNTRTRESIYWGGNLYWLLADVRIRAQTGNRRSVDYAIRAILAAGGDGAADWPLEKVLSVGDKATGTTVLQDLYDEQGPRRAEVDLEELWRKLGVKHWHGRIRFDGAAPWANIRQAITAPSGKVPGPR